MNRFLNLVQPDLSERLGLKYLRNLKTPLTHVSLLTAFLLFSQIAFSTEDSPSVLLCKTDVNLSLDQTCSGTLTAPMLLKTVSLPLSAYTIVVQDQFGNPHPNAFDYTDVNNYYQATISAVGEGSCNVLVLVEDKFAPVLTCNPVTFELPCLSLGALPPPPTAVENCSVADIVLLDEVENYVDCQATMGTVTRTWVGVDEQGNMSTVPCIQTITLTRPNLSMITAPAQVVFNCNDSYPKDANGHPLPWSPITNEAVGGVPIQCVPGLGVGVDCLTGMGVGDGAPLIPDVGLVNCNINVQYEDEVSGNACTTIITRKFTVYEWWCGAEQVWQGYQTILIEDASGPSVTCPGNLTATTGYNCMGQVNFPAITIEDDCSNIQNVQIQIGPDGDGWPGLLINGNGGSGMVPMGTHTVEYIAYDDCYNPSSCTVELTVEDNTDPVAICENLRIISLPLDGSLTVNAASFDNGSTDECGISHFRIRRKNTICRVGDKLFGPSIEFCCQDVGFLTMVELRVFDTSGNFNDCMFKVEVQDKVDPIMRCLDDEAITCTMPYDLDNLASMFGLPQIIDNCPGNLSIAEEVETDLATCGVGTITRTFSLTVNSTGEILSTCEQTINVIKDEPFTYDDIIWPADVTLTSACSVADGDPNNLPVGQGFPTYIEGACDMVGHNYNDEIFALVPGSSTCIKILRTWQVANWCQTDPFGNVQIFERVQVLKLVNDVPPTISGNCDPVVIEVNEVDCDNIPIDITNNAFDDCTPDLDLNWSWVIDINSDGNVTSNISGVGDNIKQGISSGVHNIIWTVRDECDNESSCTQQLTIINNKSPNAVCYFGLSSELNPTDTSGDGNFDNETTTINVAELDAGTTHPCLYDFDLSFSADITDVERTFDCDDVGLQDLELWVTDENGNTAVCETFVEITNNVDVICANLPRIFGRVVNFQNENLSHVEVNLEGAGMMSMTDGIGEYLFPDMPVGGDYMIVPKKNTNPLEEVSTLDLVVLKRHILKLEEFEHAYQYLAADINKSGTISSVDLIDLRKMIIGIYEEFPNNESWRFVDGSFEFDQDQNPLNEDFLDHVEVENLAHDLEVDFKGVKVGDINGSLGLWSNDVEERTNKTFTLSAIQEQNRLSMLVNKAMTITGFQCSFEIKESGLEVKEVRSDVFEISDANWSFDSETNRIHFSVDLDTGQYVPVGEVMFELICNKDLEEGSIVAATDGLRNEIYNSKLRSLELRFQSESKSTSIQLSQNYPNPWSQNTTIQYNMDEDGPVHFVVRNVQGQALMTKKISAQKGSNEIFLNKQDFAVPGLLIYELHRQGVQENGKMILLK